MKPALTLLALALVAAWPAGEARADGKAACIDAHVAGQEQQQRGALAAARASFLACATDACPAMVRRECASLLAAIDAAQPSIVVEALDAEGRPSLAPSLSIDGVDRGPGLGVLAIPLDPGEHVVRMTWPSGAVVEQRVILREGQQRELVTFRLPPPTSAAPERVRAPVPVLAWALLGAGAASLATGGVLGGIAVSKDATLVDGCGATRTCSASDVDAMRTIAGAADVALAIGVAAVVGGAVIALTRGYVDTPSVRAGGAALRF